jgi:zinc protease
LGFAAASAAGALSCGTAPMRWESGIKPFKFDLWDVHCPSGLRVIFERAPGTQTAAIAAVVGAGAIQDPPGREGLAHLVEHLTFRTHAPDEPALWPRLWALGASFNAETDFETTTYHELFPATRLADAVAAEGRRLADPLAGVDEPTFAVERDVVRNELRERNETHSFGAAWAGAFRAAFPEGHPFHRDLSGSHESTSALTLADARAYVKANYRPDNITLVVVGDMDLAQVEGFVRAVLPPALYGDPAHARPVPPPPATPATPPEPPADRTLHRERAPVHTPELWIAWPLPGGFGRESRITEMWSALTRTNFYWGRFKNDDIAHVDLVSWPGTQASLFICRVRLTKGDHPEDVLREVVTELPWIGGDEVYLDERVRQLKLGLLRELAFDAENPEQRGLARAAYAQHTGRASAYGPMTEEVQSITGDQAREFAERYLSADRARAVLIEPLADDAQPPRPIPAARDLATRTGKAPLPAETLSALARVRRLAGLRRVTLDNGLEVVAVPRPGASVVTAELAFHVDRATTRTGIDAAVEVAHELRLEESPGDYGIAFWTDFASDFAGDLDSFGSDRADDLVTFTVRAGAGNLPRALDMLSFATRSLSIDWPSDKFREVRAPLWRRVEGQPSTRADRAVWGAMFGDHPFGHVASVDEIAAHSSGELETWLDGVVRPDNGVLVVVGDVSADEAVAAARDSLSRLGGKKRGPVAAAPAVEPPAGGVALAALDGGAGAIVTHRPGASQAALDLRCLLPAADARGDVVYDMLADVVGGWLGDDLRQRYGSTYGVHAGARTLRGGTSFLRVRANIDNGRLPVALRELRRFWRSFVAEGVPADMVGRARDSVMAGRLVDYETSPSVTRELVRSWNQGWPLDTIDQVPAQIASVTPADLDGALRACASHLVLGLTGDERVIRAALAAREPAPTVPAAAAPATPPGPADAPTPAPPASPAP